MSQPRGRKGIQKAQTPRWSLSIFSPQGHLASQQRGLGALYTALPPPPCPVLLLERALMSSVQWEGIHAFSFRKRTWARAHPKLSGKGEPAAIRAHGKTQISP